MSQVTAVSTQHFRTVMGHFPTGVVVVTAADEAGRYALTLQSFQSLSLDPGLALISVARTSTSWPPIRAIGSFAVSVLSAKQGALARQFSRRDGDKFEGVDVHASPTFGHPVLSDASAWLECRVRDVADGGDHEIVIADVLDLDLLSEADEPLIFFASKFGRVQPASFGTERAR